MAKGKGSQSDKTPSKAPRGQHPNSLKNLRPPWHKGQPSPNPGGRPRKPLTDAYRALLDKPYPGDKQKRTYAEVIAAGLGKAAAKGKTEAAKEMADRVEGKVRQEITGPEGGAIPVADVNVHDKLASLADRLLDRIAKRTAKTS